MNLKSLTLKFSKKGIKVMVPKELQLSKSQRKVWSKSK